VIGVCDALLLMVVKMARFDLTDFEWG